MKYSLIVFVLIVSGLASTNADAEWTGSQILIVGALDNVMFDEKDPTYAARASVHEFIQPSTGTDLFFAYVGPRFNISDLLWISPQLGSAVGWVPDGGDAFLTSVWVGLSVHADVFVFLEGDVYLYDNTWDYYGLYSMDYMFGKVLSLGPTAEHVNTDAIVGPHMTFYTEAGPWFSTQYYVAAKSSFGHTTRFVVGLFF